MDISKLSDNGLQSLHLAMRDCVIKDESTPEEEKVYRVRATSDWKQQSDEFEAELKKRGLPFDAVPW
ncbi:hypothetical protein [Kordiimonas pumila]|uniref:Uncharacterized protein n=1 Tax=Kordiimonas pumila TaxID=2161677 RepID=A0ABV7D2P2_9PROT|nr:hypothetical protein [Kordiimonas pumila]